MWLFFLKKINLLIVTLFFLTLLSFCGIYFSAGGTMAAFTGTMELTLVEKQQLIEMYALDSGFFSQYFHYLKNIAQGIWGLDPVNGVSISQKICFTFVATLQIVVISLVIALFAGIFMGFVVAHYPKTLIEYNDYFFN